MQNDLKVIVISVLGLVLVVICFLFVCFQIFGDMAMQEYFAQGRLDVSVVEVKEGYIRPVLHIPMKTFYEVLPERKVDVLAKISGRLKNCLVSSGQMVEKDEIIGIIDTNDLEMLKTEAMGNLQSVQAQLFAAEQNLLRNKALVKDNAISPKEYDVSLAERDSYRGQLLTAETRVKGLQANIDETVIRTPVAGMIGDVYTSSGRTINSGDSYCEVMDFRTCILKITMDESVAMNLYQGMPVEILAQNKSEQKKYDATIVDISDANHIISEDKIVQIAVVVGNKDAAHHRQKNKPNIFKEGLDMRLPGKNNAILIPKEACSFENLDYYVMTLDNENKAHRKKIIVGETTPEGMIEVLSDLKVGERIIKNGVNYVKDGETVNVVSLD